MFRFLGRSFGRLVRFFRSHHRLLFENLALRQQLVVLKGGSGSDLPNGGREPAVTFSALLLLHMQVVHQSGFLHRLLEVHFLSHARQRPPTMPQEELAE